MTPRPHVQHGFGHERHGAAHEWYTPLWLFARLGLTFDLDPCAGPLRRTPCLAHYTKDDDGLALPWRGTVWLNPPYDRRVGDWLRRLERHGDGVALVFARTDAAWFHELRPHALLFLRGRVRFLHPRTLEPAKAPTAPSVLLGFGPPAVRALENCTLRGRLFVGAGTSTGAVRAEAGRR